MNNSYASETVRDRFEARWEQRPIARGADRHASRPCPIVTLIPQLIQMVNSRPDASHEELQQAFAHLVNESAFAEESGDLVADDAFTHELDAQADVMADVIQRVHHELALEGRWPEPVGSDAYVG